MSRASTKILVGIALISSIAGSFPQAAYAEPICNSATLAVGGSHSFEFAIDDTMRAHFTLESDQQDVALQINDQDGNIVCKTALPNPGYQTCGWMPEAGATYSVATLRPFATNLVDASAEVIASGETEGATNIGQGSGGGSSQGGTEGENVAAAGSETEGSVAQIVEPVLAAADATITVCNSQEE